jgi:hypothetical protein
MAHFPSGTRLALAVIVNMGSRLGHEPLPLVDFVAEQILHHRRRADPFRRAERKAADGSDMLFEL